MNSVSTLTVSAIPIALLVLALAFAFRAFKVVPQQNAWVVERLGKYQRTLAPGLNVIIPFLDRVAYRHSQKEVPLDTPSQVCITRDNTQLAVDGIIFYQVTDPMRASYGSSNYVMAITQLAQTTLRSIIGRMELDKTFEERDLINASVVSALDEAASNWGVKVLRYEIKDLTPPAEILRSMQAQITAEREKRAVIATSEGRRQEQINLAVGQRESAIQRSEGERQAEINRAQGQAAAITSIAEATASAIERVGHAASQDGGLAAMNLQIAQRYVESFGELAKQGNTLILPANLSDIAGLVASALTTVRSTQGPMQGLAQTMTQGSARGTAPATSQGTTHGASQAAPAAWSAARPVSRTDDVPPGPSADFGRNASPRTPGGPV